ncbi:hypothetical protein [Henriciella aquimarina]|uniref:hypothetical protein n=1 Tax=Henriciella aquimarina TaxID=545261 RepID=UPI000A026D4C|nr:hypothetical protein [Henriciella aquimarina]
MRLTGLALLLAGLLAACGNAQSSDTRDWQTILAEDGLAAAEAKLDAGPAAPDTDFARAGLQFLLAVEAVLQVRYDNSAQPVPLFPGMDTEIPPNPEGAFDPAFVETAMTRALGNLARAEATLDGLAGQDFAVEVPLGAIWFDINANGERDDWETGNGLLAEMTDTGTSEEAVTVRFDTADAYWLKAYVHALSGSAELILSVDPTPAIETVYEGRKKLNAIGQPQRLFIENEQLDALVATLLALRGAPERERTRRAHAHFLSMVDENRKFWEAVALETDNDREWLPNADQVSAFGVPVSAETAEGWQQTLSEIEDILKGRTLLPTWRFNNDRNAETGVGVNVSTFLQDPGDLDIILMIHGAGLAPYLETGPLAGGSAWREFGNQTGTDGFLFALWFN